jgi:hypothetical protein
LRSVPCPAAAAPPSALRDGGAQDRADEGVEQGRDDREHEGADDRRDEAVHRQRRDEVRDDEQQDRVEDEGEEAQREDAERERGDSQDGPEHGVHQPEDQRCEQVGGDAAVHADARHHLRRQEERGGEQRPADQESPHGWGD